VIEAALDGSLPDLEAAKARTARDQATYRTNGVPAR